MPRIFDNIDLRLLPDLQQAMKDAYRADFCVGYFNLRGWKNLDQHIDQWQGSDGNCVRLLVGMMWKTEVEKGRMLIVSSFKKYKKYVTKEISMQRNDLAARIAVRVLIVHASEGEFAKSNREVEIGRD